MAKIKNTGHQPRGFITEGGGHVVVEPGQEADVGMTEADFNFHKKLLEGLDDPKPYEMSGSHGAAEGKKKKDKDEVEMPAQSTEPPPHDVSVSMPVTQAAAAKREPEPPQHATTHRK